MFLQGDANDLARTGGINWEIGFDSAFAFDRRCQPSGIDLYPHRRFLSSSAPPGLLPFG
jgi:hypothetical protein